MKNLSCTGRLGRKRTGRARRVALSCRSVQVRANDIVGFVGKQFSAVRLSGIKSSGRARERGGAWVGRPRWLTILMMTGGGWIAAVVFEARRRLRKRSMLRSKMVGAIVMEMASGRASYARPSCRNRHKSPTLGHKMRKIRKNQIPASSPLQDDTHIYFRGLIDELEKEGFFQSFRMN